MRSAAASAAAAQGAPDGQLKGTTTARSRTARPRFYRSRGLSASPALPPASPRSPGTPGTSASSTNDFDAGGVAAEAGLCVPDCAGASGDGSQGGCHRRAQYRCSRSAASTASRRAGTCPCSSPAPRHCQLQLQVVGLDGDVHKQEDAVRVLVVTDAHFGKLDIIFLSTVQLATLASTEDLTPKGFRTVLEIDTLGTYTMCYEALKYLKKCGIHWWLKH